MSKERLEEIKDGINNYEKYAELGDWEASYSYIINLYGDGHIKWLIEQAEREASHSIKINKLHFFLDTNVADLASERWGHHVIDVAIYVIKEQAELVQEWRDIAKWQNDEKLKMEKIALEYEKQNKRYREAIEEAREYANSPKILTNPAGIEKILAKAFEGEK